VIADDNPIHALTPLSALPPGCSATPLASLAFSVFCLIMEDISCRLLEISSQRTGLFAGPCDNDCPPCSPARWPRPPAPRRSPPAARPYPGSYQTAFMVFLIWS